MHTQQEPIDDRVRHWIRSMGFQDLRVIDLGHGDVKLTGALESAEDRAFVLAIARTVSGVNSVSGDFTAGGQTAAGRQ